MVVFPLPKSFHSDVKLGDVLSSRRYRAEDVFAKLKEVVMKKWLKIQCETIAFFPLKSPQAELRSIELAEAGCILLRQGFEENELERRYFFSGGSARGLDFMT